MMIRTRKDFAETLIGSIVIGIIGLLFIGSLYLLTNWLADRLWLLVGILMVVEGLLIAGLLWLTGERRA